MVLYSSLNHPVRVPYGDTVIIIPPYGSVKVKKPELLGAIPKGVMKLQEDPIRKPAKSTKKSSKTGKKSK